MRYIIPLVNCAQLNDNDARYLSQANWCASVVPPTGAAAAAAKAKVKRQRGDDTWSHMLGAQL